MKQERAKELAPIIQAFADGQEIEWQHSGGQWLKACTISSEDGLNYRIKPEPKTRPMTRGEALYLMTTLPAMVTRRIGTEEMFIPGLMTRDMYNDYEYAIIDKHGEPVDGWHRFEVTE